MRIGQPLNGAIPAASSVRPSPSDASQMLQSGQALAIGSQDDKITLFDPSGNAIGNDSPRVKASVRIREALLPADYPNSVSSDYLECRKWNAVRNFAGSIVSYMGTSASLQAVGVGSGPLTVGLAWMLRDAVDGVGRFAGSIHAKEGDRDPAGMIYKGEIINNLGSMVESTLALAPGAFLAIAPAGQVVKALGATYKGAAEGPIDNHFAISNNLADMRSKNNNQDMIVNSLGGVVAFGLDRVGRHYLGPASVPLAVAGASALRIWATHKYVEALELHPTTEKTVLQSVRRWLGEKSAKETGLDKLKKLELGCPVDELLHDVPRFEELRQLYGDRNYLLDVQDGKIKAVLNQEADQRTELEAVVQAALVQRLQHSANYEVLKQSQSQQAADRWAVETSLRALPADAQSLLGNAPDDQLRFDVGKARAQWQKLPSTNGPALALADLKKLL